MSQITRVSVITTGMIVFCNLAAMAAPPASQPANIKMHRQQVTDSQARYVVRMGGEVGTPEGVISELHGWPACAPPQRFPRAVARAGA